MRFQSVISICLFMTFVFWAFLETEAQVNFSPAWGKRSGLTPMTTQNRDSEQINISPLNNCKVPIDGVVKVFKLIQAEAQRILRCEGLPQENMD